MKASKIFHPWVRTVVLFCLLAFTGLWLKGHSEHSLQKGAMIEDKRLDGLVHAPEFPEGMEWLNTGRPLSLAQLKGKIVLLDFWTFCCINCMHIIPDLKKLEAKYSEELVVIGVHSAKFTNEKGTESIRQAILRYEIKHPVVNDKDFRIWRAYAASSWPTLVLINPRGRIIGTHSGEDIFDLFDAAIGQAIRYFEPKSELKRGALELKLEEAKQLQTPLSFPGKVSADPKTSRIFITDSSHHRILMADSEGNVLEVIGSGREGAKDGAFEAAEFHHPQGTFLEGDVLYIADTENHLVRAADLRNRTVKTLLGTGKQGQGFNSRGTGTGVALNSPWDLLVHAGKLYLAMAGSHQLWAADLKTLKAEPYAGSGREARIDGPLREAALAQPSGITTDGTKLYFADSEVSSIRAADLDPKGEVKTLIGEDLFEFGDIDGDIRTARLQHALGVVFKDGFLYVADTYNSKIKIVDPAKKTSVTFAGTGRHGSKDGKRGEAEFFEPGGIAVLGERLYIADTNNHRIRVLDLKTEEVRTLEIDGIDKFSKRRAAEDFRGRIVELSPQFLKSGEGILQLQVRLPQGFKLTEKAPFHVDWKAEDAKVIRFLLEPDKIPSSKMSFPLEIPVKAAFGKTTLAFETVIYYCREDSAVCFFDEVRLQVPVEVTETGGEMPEPVLLIEVPAK